MNVMSGQLLCNGLSVRSCRASRLSLAQDAYRNFLVSIPFIWVRLIFFSRKAWFAMRNSYLKHLRTQREELEAKLELHIARYCFGEGEVDDGTEAELRQRIAEISDEIAALEDERGE